VSAVLGWIKAHLSIVILLLVIVLAPPAGCIGSSMWNESIRESQEQAAKADYDKLSRAQVTYTLPAVLPDEEPVSVRRVPNDRITEKFEQWRGEREQEVSQVVERAVALNREGHELLVPGLFPAPPQREATLMLLEFVEALTGAQGRPPALQPVLEDVNAGGPPDPVGVRQLLADYRQRALDKYEAEFGNADMPPDKEAELEDELVKRRIGAAQSRAGELAVFATPDAFPAHLREKRGNDPPGLVDAFERQWDLWIVQDIAKAVRTANVSPDGGLLSVPNAPIKRIENLRIQVLPTRPGFDIPDISGSGPLVATDPSVSITGRLIHRNNNLYDVRPLEVELIVESSQMPRIIEAFNSTNLMTVLEADLSEIDVYEHLREGYYYGPDHVVRATLTVETVWLRQWTAPLMPEDLRGLMYVPDPEDTDGAG